MRIYADESGTHLASESGGWLVIGMLFVPDHGILQSALCAAKNRVGYLNIGARRARYREIHFTKFKSPRDVEVGKLWVDEFLASQSVFRCIAIDWSIFDGSHFGNPFEPNSLKERRAYKKWAEMLLQPELLGMSIQGATLYLDQLRVLHGYEIDQHLLERFRNDADGEPRRNSRIQRLQLAESWKDANQCLQLCDLLTGCVYQSLSSFGGETKSQLAKREVVDHLFTALEPFGVRGRKAGYWRGFGKHVRRHFGKFSVWCWRPDEA